MTAIFASNTRQRYAKGDEFKDDVTPKYSIVKVVRVVLDNGQFGQSALIFDERRTLSIQQRLPPHKLALMGDRRKCYFYARPGSGVGPRFWILLELAPEQEW